MLCEVRRLSLLWSAAPRGTLPASVLVGLSRDNTSWSEYTLHISAAAPCAPPPPAPAHPSATPPPPSVLELPGLGAEARLLRLSIPPSDDAACAEQAVVVETLELGATDPEPTSGQALCCGDHGESCAGHTCGAGERCLFSSANPNEAIAQRIIA